jgi:ATP synthase protein I
MVAAFRPPGGRIAPRKVRPPRMSEDPPPDPLARLGEKIDTARREQLEQRTAGRGAAPPGALGLGFRMATELAAALIVGLALGWLALRFLPAPWGVIGLIVFFFLGVAAGMLNVFRAAKGVGQGGAAPRARSGNRPPPD